MACALPALEPPSLTRARSRTARLPRSLLHEAGVPFVAGWSSIVADAAAPFFARGFLAALQGGKDYAEAYALGVLEVTTQTEGPDPSLLNLKTATNGLVGAGETTRFQLVDPKSSLVVQKAEVHAPHTGTRLVTERSTSSGLTGSVRASPARVGWRPVFPTRGRIPRLLPLASRCFHSSICRGQPQSKRC